MIWNILVALAVGALSGWLAGLIMGSNHSLPINILIGIVGGAIGKLLGSLIQIGSNGLIGDIIFSVVGACLLIWLSRLIAKK